MDGGLDLFSEVADNPSDGAWSVSAVPVLALTVLPYLYWRPGLWLTLPLGAVYSVGLYVLTLGPLARLLQIREHEILKAVADRG